ncbi:peroxidase [bacterium]|nr:peroxidase [bacterium]
MWTTWSRKNQVKGLMMLAEMRRNLNQKNLFHTYPEGVLTGFARPGMEAPEWTRWARTADGSWNNPADPLEGAALTRFGRNINPELCKVDEANLLTPNPREISRLLMTRDEGFKAVPFLNMMAAAWIQFQNHDWVSHGDNNTNEFYEIPLAPDDPARQRLHMTHMFVPKTSTDPLRQAGEKIAAPVHVNEVTHWWDGSQIYGSDLDTQQSLRSHKDGKLTLTEDGRLPVDSQGVEKTGFRRNWWVGLSLLHTLFSREHNAICDMLRQNHPDWDDEKLFQTARLINAAVMAKIHTVEWTPAVLPNKTLNTAMNANWYGAATKWLRHPDQRQTVAKFDLHEEISGGLVGGPLEKHGVPESRTEEFTSVYRLHPLLPESLELRRIGATGPAEQVPLAQTRQKASHELTDKENMADLLNSFGIQSPGQLVLNNYPQALQDLSVPGFAFFDLAAVDILRDRERGVPRYNEFRRQLQLQPIHSFDDISDDPKVVEKLKAVYGEDVEKLDLLVGTLAEGHRPENFGFGETLFQVFILNASRRLQDDRFYTTDYNAATYTQEGLDWIDQASMKSVLLRHHPDLAGTGLKNVTNAFEPWDTGELAKDPGRHPLNQYKA